MNAVCDCARFDELLMASAGSLDSLDEVGHAQYAAHLDVCPNCPDKMKQYVLTIGILRTLKSYEDEEPAPPLSESLVQRIVATRAAAKASERGHSEHTG